MEPRKASAVAGLLAALALPGLVSAKPSSLAVTVVEPRPGTALVAGSQATLSWAPAAGAPAPPGDEWEAFVSLDGGRTYSVRITPHLDQSRRIVRWTVPEVPSRDVRLLLRFGDEEHESALEVRSVFSIVAGPAPALPPLRVSRPGEAARPGDRGVVVWEEGSRSGGRSQRVMLIETTLRQGCQNGLDSGSERSPSFLTCTTPTLPHRSEEIPDPRLQAAAVGSPSASPVRSVDRLLQTARLNE